MSVCYYLAGMVLLSSSVCLASGVLLAPEAAVPNRIESVSWIVGDWAYETDRQIICESWTRVDDQTLRGRGSFRSESPGSPESVEALMIVELHGELFYIAFPEQNQYPVAFKLVSNTDGKLIFENPTHDFPQRIVYHPQGDGSLLVHIEGETKGRTRRLDFHYSRQP